MILNRPAHFNRIALHGLLGTLALLGARPPQAALRATPRPAAVRPRPAPARPRGYFKIPSGAERTRFYSEFRRNGWEDVQIATVTPGYTLVNGVVNRQEPQFATFFGDVDGDRRPEWVVGCYFNAPPNPGRPVPPGGSDDRARIVVFKKNAKGEWQTWRSAGLGNEFAEPRFNREEVENGLDRVENLLLPLSLVDVDRDGQLEIAYHCLSRSGLGDLPGVLRYENTRWVSIAPQADRFSLQDLDRDGKLEAVTGSRRIGSGSGDDDVPRVWRWDSQRRQFREASRDFPQFYSDLANRYQLFIQRKEAKGEEIDRSVWERAIQKANSMAG